ncbi:MAG: hypothetical protein R3C52_09805 [Hyphomonadaceae bacterium]
MTPSDSEIEAQRKEALQRLSGALHLGVPVEEAFAPGTLGCHEALHTASLVLDMLERHLFEHPAIASNPEWYKQAAMAHHHLFTLYQAIGGTHLDGAQARDD